MLSFAIQWQSFGIKADQHIHGHQRLIYSYTLMYIPEIFAHACVNIVA